jgi:hypothetical protein
MKNILIVLIFLAVVIGGAFLLIKQSRFLPVLTPQPVATSTQASPSPYGPQAKCDIFTTKISTSTWKTFKVPSWEITFQYPANWTLVASPVAQNGSSLHMSGGGAEIDIKVDNEGESMAMGVEEPYFCSRMVAGKQVDVGEFLTLPTTTRLFGVSKSHSYIVWIIGSSTTYPITDTILNTMGFTNK